MAEHKNTNQPNQEEIKRFRIKIFGKVQGVGFRFYAKDYADRFGVAGWVKNEPDGSVTIDAQGPEEGIEKFLEWCRQGPEFGRIKRTEVEELPPKDSDGFKIIY